MSILGKKWLIKNTKVELTTVEKIIENRDFATEDEISDFYDPFLFQDMGKAYARIRDAIERKERIIVFGDYDVDGMTGTAILVHILKKIGAEVSYRIPNREKDGYGLSEKYIDEFKEKEVSLIITVDCGISCFNQVEKASGFGIDTIITDHHSIPAQVPKAYAIIHPIYDDNYPYKGLTGAGVALKLAHALIIKYFDESRCDKEVYGLLDLASLGTVADLGPLRGENRLIVRKGLEVLAETQWVGLRKIMALASIKDDDEIDAGTIGFRIAPRINAAGRIGDPYVALGLLLQEIQNEKVEILGNRLEELNNLRQQMTTDSLLEAEAFFPLREKLPFILIAESPDWHVGILGLLAGRLAEKLGRPAIAMQEIGDMLVASARSPQYFNIVEAIADSKELLVSFGGHAQAAGFNIKKKNLNAFKEKINLYAEQKLQGEDLRPVLEIDCELPGEEIDFSLIDQLDNLQPFGVANTTPTFLLKNLKPHFIDKVGREGKHLKFSIKIEDRDIKVIAFNMGEHAEKLREHRSIDLVCNIDRNIWKNKESLQLRVLDFRESGM